MSHLQNHWKLYRIYIFLLSSFLIISYSVYFIFNREIICQIGTEDSFFEYLTALLFLCSSIFFLLSYISVKNPWFLLLSIVFLIGTGEELSWGQRIVGFSTPDCINEINVQHEFNLHNIELFNGKDFNHNLKTGFDKLLSVSYLYKLFCMGYCILLPIVCLSIRRVSLLSQKLKLPIPPLTIGIFFLVNWLLYKITLSLILPRNEIIRYYRAIEEIRECCSAFIFFALSYYFLKNEVINMRIKRQKNQEY